MFKKPNKMVCTREDGGMWWNRCDGKTKDVFGSDESMSYRLILANVYNNILICVQSKQDRKQKEYLTFVDYVNGKLLDYVRKSNKIISIKNHEIKIMV